MIPEPERRLRQVETERDAATVQVEALHRQDGVRGAPCCGSVEWSQGKVIRQLCKENAQLKRTLERIEQQLKERDDEIARLRVSNLTLSKYQFGRKSEQGKKSRSECKRGQPPGQPGHGRTPRPTLESHEEIQDLSPSERCCTRCGKPFARNGSQTLHLYEVMHQAMVRHIQTNAPISPPPAPRKRGRPTKQRSIDA